MFSKKRIKNEEGSMTIEFIGLIPLIFLMLIIFWQFMVGAYAVFVTHSAANEAAKIYSYTKSEGEAIGAAQKILQTSGQNVHYDGLSVSGDSDFSLTLNAELELIFLPSEWGSFLPRIDFSKSVSGRVIE